MDVPVTGQAATSFPTPLVVGDVGGTNVRLACVEAPGGPLRSLGHLRTADHAGPAEAIRAATASLAAAPRAVVLCAAGPVNGRRCELTNAHWVIDGPDLAAELGLAQGLLLNDFEAQALALPAIPSDGLLTIGPDLPAGSGPRVVLGPGTGLGVGALLNAGGRHVPLPSEGGHVELAAVEGDRILLGAVEKVLGRLTGEAVLSGAGLARLHRARCQVHGAANTAPDAVAVVNRAVADPTGAEAATIALFLSILARFAGDMAITFGATGGVFLAGGILPRVRGLIDPAAFRAGFEAKQPVDWLPRSIATRLIVSADAVLHGMAAIASRPENYLIDFTGRCWR